jgi:hypothetical protein
MWSTPLTKKSCRPTAPRLLPTLLVPALLACLLLPCAAASAQTLVQHCGAGLTATGAGSVSCTLSGTGAGNLVVIGVYFETNVSISSVAVGSSSGAAIGSRNTHPGCSTCYTQTAYVQNVAGGQTACTVNFSGSATWRGIVCAEFSGMAATGALDQAGVANGTSTTPASPSVTTAQAEELLLGFGAEFEGRTWTAGTNYTAVRQQDIMFMESRGVSATGSYNAPASLSSSSPWAMHIATFRVAAAGAPRRRGLVIE